LRDAVNMETLFALAADHRRILAISSGGAMAALLGGRLECGAASRRSRPR